MGSEMLRKQVYIYRRQEKLLKTLAKKRGISEAEIIRRAIDLEAAVDEPMRTFDSSSSLDEIIRTGLARRALGGAGEAYRFNRDDAYEEPEPRIPLQGG